MQNEHHEHHHHHDHDTNMTPEEELVTMLKYMVGHNAHHVDEMADLADKVREDHPETTTKIQEAVAEFRKGNGILEEALKELEG